ncbi:MAG: carboxylating nicotinate-nucleotide diphosphorylase [Bdellovibrionaceae bacterium]|nr:carboxylating nicotinate-nucleotide diphosphorylase [Bdellovibrionales bacterium]MCB9084494.1 carboxylating nicotinate-nucleotide diphosphorylase [Pseudobdellovibrionaceae bacterium]
MTLNEIVRAALREDLPDGDLTTDNLGIKEKYGRALLMAKEDLVLSGKEFFATTVHELDEGCQVQWQFDDGDFVLNGQTVATISGNLISVIKAERVGLNFLGHFSGIATYTRCFADQTKDTKCRILDTRKTLPLYREWEKKAVRDGRGHNHRMNLSDAVLIKENHIRLAGGMRQAIEQIRSHVAKPIEVECTNLDEVQMAVNLKVQRILLDNMNDEEITEALKKIPGSISVEASGNMSLDRVGSVAMLGVHDISVGALTHSAPCADFSLLFDWGKQ